MTVPGDREGGRKMGGGGLLKDAQRQLTFEMLVTVE